MKATSASAKQPGAEAARTVPAELTVGQLRSLVTGWSGPENVTITEALVSIEARVQATIEHEAEQREAEARRQGWLNGRREAGRAAYQLAHGKMMRAGRGSPEAAAAGREAANKAIVEYERRHALPPGLPTAILREPPSPIRAAIAKARELVS